MQFLRKKAIVTFLMLMAATNCLANKTFFSDSHDAVQIKHGKVDHAPKDSSILAYIDGHSLTVTFTENLGTVQVDVTTALGDRVEYTPIWTPDSFTTYIASTGSYVVTITLPNGDEYYGEFDVTD